MNDLIQSEYYKDLEKLAPMGVLKESLKLYDKQVCEFISDGKVSEKTKVNIYTFGLFCGNNDYQKMVVVPLWAKR